jgi:dipeptidyl aminopeptidase/acylaminoacyl peptidase
MLMSRPVALAVTAAAALLLAVSASGARAVAVFDFFELSLADGASHGLPWAPGAGYITDLSPDRTSVLYGAGGTLTVARIDGSGARRIIDLPHQILAATWSPDGRAIAFELADTTACPVAPRPCGDFQIWLVGRDGGGLRMLADNAAEPAWSSDSRRLAFVGDYDTPSLSGTVSIENIDGTGHRALTAREKATRPSWSRDSRFIAYTRVVAAGRRDVVRVLEVHRPKQGRTIARGDTAIWLASARLAVVRHLAHNREGLFLTDSSRRNIRQLSVEGGIESATPSPDGHRIAYADGKTLVVVTAVGRHGRKGFPIAGVTGSNLTIRTIRWARDGTSLFYVRMLSGPGP